MAWGSIGLLAADFVSIGIGSGPFGKFGESGSGSGSWGSGGSSIGGRGNGVTRSISSAKWGNQVGMLSVEQQPFRAARYSGSLRSFYTYGIERGSGRRARRPHRGRRRGAPPQSCKPMARRHSGVGGMILRV